MAVCDHLMCRPMGDEAVRGHLHVLSRSGLRTCYSRLDPIVCHHVVQHTANQAHPALSQQCHAATYWCHQGVWGEHCRQACACQT